MTHAPSLRRILHKGSVCALILASVFSLSTAWGQDTATTSNSSTTPPSLVAFEHLSAQPLDEGLRAALLTLAAQELSGNFKESRTLPGFPKPMVSQGIFQLKGNELSWVTKTPFPSTLHVSPAGIVMEADGERQTLSSAEIPTVGRVAEMLSAILSGRLSVLEERFEIRAERKADRIRLAARPKSNANTQLMRVMKALRASALLGENAHMDAIEFEAADGTLTRIELARVKVTH